MILHYGKVPFTNVIIDRETEWPELKSKVEFGFLPQLEIDGKVYSQSFAFNIYLAKKLGLMGKDVEDEYNITTVLSCHSDLSSFIYKVFFPSNEYEKKPEVLKANTEAFLAKLESIVAALEARYAKNGNKKYYLGDSITLADFWIANTLGLFFLGKGKDMCESTIRKAGPNLAKLAERLVAEDFKSFLESDLFIKGSI
eukprot:CAMPEP_0170514880 /NCGR_PEP_ID=MMETSP0209-20121228/1400_1 /TAXON_ID=665100 ORGANISM="Litonotus pictus, Strain P1" /NCGR_SAMPLE_ID=MMETSP0209 /ASSEMBLY_ACC=CAM_ASM_000301 /LENGTH=197 /DNA_ID=CAMNT_0010799135 /DNA_START=77 /DNA_END=670 /DNA_ORIENTATION=+